MIINKVTKDMTNAQIQKVLSQGGMIQFEKSTYLITKPLEIYSNSIIDLGGSILRQGGRINHILLTHSDKDTTEYSGVNNVILFNGTLEGMGKYSTKLNLLTLCHSSNIYIHNVTFQDVVEFHSIEINSSQDVRVKACKFLGFNSSLDRDDFREYIQIDYAIESALVIVPFGSKWYDGTPCENITIENCIFGKSENRPTASQCIGNHCQVTGRKHSNITICNNTFEGENQGNKNAPCIRLIGMDNVIVKSNICSRYGRFVQVLTYAESYDMNGHKVDAMTGDGICRNVIIEDNLVSEPSGTVLSPGVFITSVSEDRHEQITIQNNILKLSSSKKAVNAIDMKYVNGYNIKDNDTNGLKTITKYVAK